MVEPLVALPDSLTLPLAPGRGLRPSGAPPLLAVVSAPRGERKGKRVRQRHERFHHVLTKTGGATWTARVARRSGRTGGYTWADAKDAAHAADR